METESVIRNRRSIRAFQAKSIPDATLHSLLDVARWSPSWANTQSPTLHVVTGSVLDEIRTELQKKVDLKEERSFDITPPNPTWPKRLADRTERLIAARTEVTRADSNITTAPGPAAFFGAPAVIFVTADAELRHEYAAFDAGLLTQTIALTAHDLGLGTCIMAMTVAYPDVLRRLLPQTVGKHFIVAIALGFPDRNAPVNAFQRERAPLEEQVTWTK